MNRRIRVFFLAKPSSPTLLPVGEGSKNRGVRCTEVVEASGSILFRNVKIEPAEKGRSLNSRPT